MFLHQCNVVFRFNKANPDKEVFLVAATNFPDSVDDAVWRRIKKFIMIPPQTDEDRKTILTQLMQKAGCVIEPEIDDEHWRCLTLFTHG